MANGPVEQAQLAQLATQLQADPRVQQWIRTHPNTGRGTAAMPSALLRSWGYNVPESYVFTGRGFTYKPGDHGLLGDIIVGLGGTALGLGGLGAAGVGPLAGGPSASAGSAGSAASGVLPSSSLPASLGMNAVPGSIASQGVSAGVPLGGIAAGTGGSGAAVAGGGAAGSMANRLRDSLLSPEGMLSAAGIVSALAGGNGMSAEQRAAEEQARRMAAITEARARRVDPLHEAVTQLAFSRLPVSSRDGITLSRVPLPG